MPGETISMAWFDNVACGMDLINSLILTSIFQNDIM